MVILVRLYWDDTGDEDELYKPYMELSRFLKMEVS